MSSQSTRFLNQQGYLTRDLKQLILPTCHVRPVPGTEGNNSDSNYMDLKKKPADSQRIYETHIQRHYETHIQRHYETHIQRV